MDVKDLKEILRTLDERQIAEFELETEGMKLRVRKASAFAAPAAPAPLAPAAPALTPATPAAPAAGARPGEPAAEEGLALVKSPIVGTFYRSPNPEAAPFASVGDKIRVGQVLCIVEAMKLMNEIESDVAGEVVKVHVENGQPVQFGDPLFSLRPAR